MKWFRLRVAFAAGVLIPLVVELSGHRTWEVVVLQALFIVGIIVTSALDIAERSTRQPHCLTVEAVTSPRPGRPVLSLG